jgi:hypothetical protein
MTYPSPPAVPGRGEFAPVCACSREAEDAPGGNGSGLNLLWVGEAEESGGWRVSGECGRWVGGAAQHGELLKQNVSGYRTNQGGEEVHVVLRKKGIWSR